MTLDSKAALCSILLQMIDSFLSIRIKKEEEP